MMIKKRLLLLIFILGLSSVNSLAAETEKTDPNPNPNPNAGTIQQSVENRDYLKLERELQEKKKQEEKNVTDETVRQEPETPDATAQILVKKIMTDPSAILSDAEITAITGKYEGRSVTIQELYQALKEINDLYAQKGFITAKAILPPQKVENGVVHVKLVEAHFGELTLGGNEHTRDSYIFKRLSEHNGGLVNIKTLEEDIFYFNRTNDLQIKAELKPGNDFGLTDCVLQVAEPDNIQGTLFSDNEGSKNTGKYRLGFSWADNSLTGNRDYLMVNPLWSEGTWAGSLSYNLPITRKGTRLGVSYSNNQSSVISGPYDSLDIQSDESDIGLNLSHPLRVKPNFKFDGMASLFNKKASTDFSDKTLIDYHVNTFSLGLAFQNIDQTGFWYHRYDLTYGDSGVSDAFYKFNLTAARQQTFKKDQLMICRLTGQLTNGHLLPSTEEFSIGGMTTVRGYRSGALSGDKGYNLSVEYDFPIQSFNKVKGLCFIDHGGAFPFKGNNQGTSGEDYLTSIGMGANFGYSQYLSGKLVIGVPIDPPEDEGGVKIEFYLQSVLF
jgi:hemolysin activation/secretion protein